MKRRRYVNCLFLFVNTSSWYRFSFAEDPLAVLAYETQSSQQHEEDIDDLSQRCEDISEVEEVRAVSCLNNAVLSLDSETDSFNNVQRFLKPIGSYFLTKPLSVLIGWIQGYGLTGTKGYVATDERKIGTDRQYKESDNIATEIRASSMVAREIRLKCVTNENSNQQVPSSSIISNSKHELTPSGTVEYADDKTEIYRYFGISPSDCDLLEDYDYSDDTANADDNDVVCISLEVLQYDRNSGKNICVPKVSYKYELIDPVELKLGINIRHAVDFAYMPVLFSGGDPWNSFNIPYGSPDEIQLDMSYEADTSLVEEVSPTMDQWWQWWIPSRWWKNKLDYDSFSTRYRRNAEAFAGGSHGEVWRGRRKCNIYEWRIPSNLCGERLIFKRLRVEAGFFTLEAGLREVYFGSLLQSNMLDLTLLNGNSEVKLFTEYVDHFFGLRGELWIVFRDAGPSLRSYLYTATKAGDFVVFQNSWFWTLLRMSVAKKDQIVERKSNLEGDSRLVVASVQNRTSSDGSSNKRDDEHLEDAAIVGRALMRSVLRQILHAASILHNNGIIHRDIKPSNVMCTTNFDPELLETLNIESPEVYCVLGDFSSAYNDFCRRNLYMNGPSRLEQTDEYAPPEAFFGNMYNQTSSKITPSFDSWSIGVVALELLLGSPNVFSVDQRTRVVLSHKMKRQGASNEDIEKALYLAALSQFCIYNPHKEHNVDWPLRDGDPLHNLIMTKKSCTLYDFHRALRTRDPLGWGFKGADALLHLIWQLLAWNPSERITALEALNHPYFTNIDEHFVSAIPTSDDFALESRKLDPRMDFHTSDAVSDFKCPKCGRVFHDWKSCLVHATFRKHAKFCTYDKSKLPTCLHAHGMLPAHSTSGYCDIQGRRPTMEDFHAIHLLPSRQFYGIFDGHLGNFASKFAASFLHKELVSRLNELRLLDVDSNGWKVEVAEAVSKAFHAVHENFLEALELRPFGFMDNSGTTATTAIISNTSLIVASLGDSRAVISSRSRNSAGDIVLSAFQLTTDHQASNESEKQLVEDKGGTVIRVNGVDRVNGVLVVTRSIGDANLAHWLSREPQVIAMSRDEMKNICGSHHVDTEKDPCFLIVASDGLWDTMSIQEAVDMVANVIAESMVGKESWNEGAGFQLAAEALTLESYVRGSTDNIGVCIVALD